MCVDNDDGSAYYKIYNNFEIYGGHKSDFGGHNKFTFDSVVAFAQDYQSGLCGDFGNAIPGFVDGYYNNTCVQAAVVPYITVEACNLNDPNSKVDSFFACFSFSFLIRFRSCFLVCSFFALLFLFSFFFVLVFLFISFSCSFRPCLYCMTIRCTT